MATVRKVEVKRSCCQSSPRCRRCPLVAKRLASVGLAERTGKRTYLVDAPKKAVKAARRKHWKAAEVD
jgi:hypothetical protein